MPMPSRLLRCEPLEDRLAPAAGDLDPTFGDGGRVVLSPDLGPDGFPESFEPVAVAVDSAGRVLAAGFTYVGPPLWVARLTADGGLDPTFGTGGKTALEFGFQTLHLGVSVQVDGRVVLAGSIDGGPQSGADFLAVRLTADGQLDPTFGVGGKVTVAFGEARNDAATAVAIQSDGRIVLAGHTYQTGAPTGAFAAARLTADGQLDPTFDGDGRVIVSFPVGSFDKAEARAVAVRPDGVIVLAGGVVTDSGERVTGPHTPNITAYFEDFAAVQLTADGLLDPGFGDGGRVRIPFDLGKDNNDAAYAVGIRSDGRIVLAGAGTEFVPNAVGYAAARLTADGRLDPTFDGDGKASGPASGEIDSVVVQPDGRVVFAGVPETLLMTADGPLDPAFGSGGRVPTPSFSGLDGLAFLPRGLAVQPDGRILLAGRRQGEGLVERLLGNGPAGFASATPGTVLSGGAPDGSVRILKPSSGAFGLAGTATYFPDAAVTVRTAVADVTGDGVPDYVGGAGLGGGPRVVILDGKTGAERVSFFAFEPGFTGGVYVAAADLDGDGKAEVVVTPDQGGGPVVAVFDGTGAERTRFFGIEDPAFRGGARAALGDVNADGTPDLVVSAGFGGGPRVALFDGATLTNGSPVKLTGDFFAFEPGLRNGAFVAAGDVTGDGFADLAFGGGPGGAPRVRLFDGKALLAAGPFASLDEVPAAQRANFFAGDSSLRGGVRLALRDAAGDGTADLLAGSGEGEPSRVRVYTSANLLANPVPAADQELDPFGAALADGVFVG